MVDKLERKFGKYAVPRLMMYIIGCYIVGYVLSFMGRAYGVNIVSYLQLEPYYIIHHFQFWRLFTWVLIPPQENIFFALIMCFFYYQLGNMMEQTWGTFKFNLYMFGGFLCTVIGAFILYAVYTIITGGPVKGTGMFFSTYYINLSIFLAFAACYPEQRVMLYFIFPIRIKILAYVYVAIVLLQAFSYGGFGIHYVVCYTVAVVCSLLNFLIFFLGNKRTGFKNAQRRKNFTNAYNSGYQGFSYQSQEKARYQERPKSSGPSPKVNTITRHKCAVCGRSELDGANIEFRFCSKCNGNYEYCQEHLFTHTHVK